MYKYKSTLSIVVDLYLKQLAAFGEILKLMICILLNLVGWLLAGVLQFVVLTIELDKSCVS